MPSVSWTRRALRRLDAIGASIAKDSPRAASRIVSDLVRLADDLSRMPLKGRPGRIEGTREIILTRAPYIMVYRIEGTNDILILTILHMAQEWPQSL